MDTGQGDSSSASLSIGRELDINEDDSLSTRAFIEEGFQLLKTIKSRWDEGKKLSIIDVDIDSGNAC